MERVRIRGDTASSAPASVLDLCGLAVRDDNVMGSVGGVGIKAGGFATASCFCLLVLDFLNSKRDIDR